MNKLLIILCFSLLLVGSVSYVSYDLEDENGGINLEEQQYQGPVPIGYNLEHFRKTGETIKEVID